MMLFPAAALSRLLLKARGMENRWHSGSIKEERRAEERRREEGRGEERDIYVYNL